MSPFDDEDEEIRMLEVDVIRLDDEAPDDDDGRYDMLDEMMSVDDEDEDVSVHVRRFF